MTEQPPTPEAVTQPADPWPHSPYPPLPPAAGTGARRRAPWQLAAVAGTAVLAAVAFLVALSWPEGAPPEPAAPFRPLEPIWEVNFAQPAETGFSQVAGGIAYLGWQQGADLELAAVTLDTGEPVWQRRLAGREGYEWSTLVAGPGAVAVIGYPIEDESDPMGLLVVDAETGGERYQWDRDIYPDDEVWMTEHALVLVDRDRGALRGLRLDTGVHRWVVPFPGTPDADAAVAPVLTDAQLAAPSTWWGEPARVATGPLLLVGEDRSAQVIDTQTGEPIGPVGTNVASPDDLLLAYQDRLFVATNHEGYQVHAWQLAGLAGQPEHIYTMPDSYRRPTALAPCGAGRICLLDDRYDWYEPGTELRMLTKDRQEWVRAVPGAQWLVPVGDWLLAGGGDPVLVGYDRRGEQVLTRADGVAARLDEESLLFVSGWPDSHSQELSLSGQRLGGDRIELGQLTDVRGEGCSWTEQYLVCPGEEGAGIWSFR